MKSFFLIIEHETDPLVKRELQEEYDKKIKYLKKMNAIVDEEGRDARPPKLQRRDNPHRKTAQNVIRKSLENAYSAFKKSGLKKMASHFKKNIRPAGDYDFQYRDTETYWNIKL